MSATLTSPRVGAPRKFPDEDLVELIKQGLSNVELARRFNCCARTIARRRSQLGLSDPHPRVTFRFSDTDRGRLSEMVADEWPLSEIMATTGWEYRTIRRHSPVRAGWDAAACGAFAATVSRIRSSAVRPDWLPRISGP